MLAMTELISGTDMQCPTAAITACQDGAENQAPGKILRKQRVVRPPTLSLPATRSVSIPMQPPKERIDEESTSGVAFGVTARRGRRRQFREDMYVAIPLSSNRNRPELLSIFAVLDGHGGNRASKFASERLSQMMSACSDLSTAGLLLTLRNAFLQTDAEFVEGGNLLRSGSSRNENSKTKSGSRFGSVALQKAVSREKSIEGIQLSRAMRERSSSEGILAIDSVSTSLANVSSFPFGRSYSRSDLPVLERVNSRAEEQLSASSVLQNANCGTTATLALILDSRLFVAHVGDSRAVLCHEGEAIRLIQDHRPSRPDEAHRIESAGGLIMRTGGTARVNGVLAVSRAIGNYIELKKYVIAEPEIFVREVNAKDEFMLMASDGLWDFLSDQESIDIARKLIANPDQTLAQVSKMLVCTACDRGSKDDVCVLVVDLRKHMTQLEESKRLSGNCLHEDLSKEVPLSNLELDDRVPGDRNGCRDQTDPALTPRRQYRQAW
jgi:serine/threonine protein phosphatase PrpC